MQGKLTVKKLVEMRNLGRPVGRRMPLVWIRRFPEMASPLSAWACNLQVEVSGREGRLGVQGGAVQRG